MKSMLVARLSMMSPAQPTQHNDRTYYNGKHSYPTRNIFVVDIVDMKMTNENA